MYYLELIQRFWDFNHKAKLNTTAIAVYFYLLNLANNRNNYDVTISDVVLSNALAIARTTLKPAKDKLRDLGLIEYETKNGFPCHYRLFLNYSFDSESEELKHKENTGTEGFQQQASSKILQKNILPIQISPDVIAKVEDSDNGKSSSDTLQQKQSGNYNNNPSWDEFIEYTRMLDGYEISLESDVKEKYDSWSKNKWINASGRPITNWKSTLKSILPYMKNSTKEDSISLKEIPSIKRPEPQQKNQ